MRVLITRPKKQAGDFANALRSIGADPVLFPTIAIRPANDLRPLDNALSGLERYDWIILTSANAAEMTIERMAALGMQSPPQNVHLAAIGPKTAAKLDDAGIQPDFVPQKYIAEAILPGLGTIKGRWFLLPMADIAHDTLPRAIQMADGISHVVTVYHTLPAKPDRPGLTALQEGVDVITFTSGSTVRNFIRLVQEAGLDPFRLPGLPKIACIGPKTAGTAAEAGFQVDFVADPHTTDGLVDAIFQEMSA